MDIPVAAQALAEGLARALGVEDLAFDPEDGSLTLELDGHILVSIAVDGGGETLTLFAPITAERLVDPDLAWRALEANFLWLGTTGATLAVEPSSGQLVLHRRLPLDGLDDPALISALEAFAAQAASWGGAMAAASPGNGDAPRFGDQSPTASEAIARPHLLDPTMRA
jgi:hypothetical protein